MAAIIAKIFRNGLPRRDFARSARIFTGQTSYRLKQRNSFQDGIKQLELFEQIERLLKQTPSAMINLVLLCH